ncbi:MAG: helix-turn-helix domain-containing protein [bacterium]
MAKLTRSRKALPTSMQKAISLLGRDIATARTRRRIPQRLFAQRMMVSLDTLQRLEKGDPGVSLGVVASALWALGLGDRLKSLAAPDHDTVGTMEELARLPRRVRRTTPNSALDF